MKNNKTSINKMIRSFDKELKTLLLNDLKIVGMASKALVKKINKTDSSLNRKQLKIA